MQWVSGVDVVGVDGGEHGDAQLVAAELAVVLGVDDAVGAQDGATRCRRRRPSRSMVPTTLERMRRVGHERRGVRVTPRPSRRGCRPTRAAAGDADVEAAVAVHPLQLLLEQEQRGQRRRVVGLVEAAVVEGDLEVERGRDPAAATRRSARCARWPRASTARSTGRRRRRSTSAGRSSRRRPRPVDHGSPPAPEVASTDDERRRRPTGRSSGIITPVDVSLWVRA